MSWLTTSIIIIGVWLLVAILIMLVWYLRAVRIYKEFSLSYRHLSLNKFIAISLQILIGSAKLIWWRLSKRSKSTPELSGEPHETHILCVHGFQMNGSCFWGMRKSLARSGYKTSVVNLGMPYIPVEKYISRLEKKVEQLLSQNNIARISIIAHSMGGLITRLLLQKRPDLADKITIVITLGTPHYGTRSLTRYHSKWVDTLFRVDSQFLLNIPSFNEISSDLKTYSVASHHDFIVFPEELALLSGSEHILVENISHIGLLTEQSSHTLVQNCLQ